MRPLASLPGAKQSGEPCDRECVAVDAKSGDHRLGHFRNIGIVPEAFARMNVGDVHLDRGKFHCEKCIHDGDRRRSVAGRIYDDGAGIFRMRLLNPVDQFAFPVRLPKDDIEAEPLGGLGAQLFHVGKRRATVFSGSRVPSRFKLGPLRT